MCRNSEQQNRKEDEQKKRKWARSQGGNKGLIKTWVRWVESESWRPKGCVDQVRHLALGFICFLSLGKEDFILYSIELGKNTGGAEEGKLLCKQTCMTRCTFKPPPTTLVPHVAWVWQSDNGSVWNPLINPLMSSDVGNQAVSSTWQVRGQVASR